LTGNLKRGQVTHHPPETSGHNNEAPHDNVNGNKTVSKAIRRNRHYAWVRAHELTRQWFSPVLIDDEIRFAREYVESVDKYYLIFLCFDCDGGMRPLPKPYIHRLSKAYAQIIWKRLKKYYYPVLRLYKQFMLMTLTIDPKMFVSQYDAYRTTIRTWNSLRTRMRKRYKNDFFIRTNEWQKNGIGFHLHVLVAGRNYIPKDWVEETWSKLTKSGWGVELTPIRGDADYVLKYIFKYIMKGYGEGIDNLSAVLNWAVGTRAFDVSMPRGIRKRLQRIRELERIEYRARVSMMCPCGVMYLGKVDELYVSSGVALDMDWVMDYFRIYERGLPGKGPPIPE